MGVRRILREYITKADKFHAQAQPYWYMCKNCDQKYSSKGRCCPVCGSYYAKVVIDPINKSIPADVMFIQEDCSICKIFQKRNDSGNYVFGPDCNSFGKGTKPFGQQCRDCSCGTCCGLAGSERRNKWAFEERLRAGKIEMPWIDMERQSPKNVHSVRELAENKKA